MDTSEEIKRLIGVLGGKIDSQNEKMGMAQKKSNVRMDDIAQQHKDNVNKLEQSIWALAQQQTDLTTQQPPLIQTEIEARTEANR